MAGLKTITNSLPQSGNHRTTTRRSRNAAAGQGADVSPLQALQVPKRTRAAPVKSRLIAQPQPSSSNDDADDTSSHHRDSRSQSIDESESPSSTPPAVQQPSDYTGRDVSESQSASDVPSEAQPTKPTRAKRGRPASASTAKAQPTASRKVAVPKTRKAKAKAETTAAASRPRRGTTKEPEASSIEESDSKTSLPGTFPSAIDDNSSTPIPHNAAERVRTPALYNSPSLKRTRESSTDRSVDSDRAKRVRAGSNTPDARNHTFATERVVLQQTPNATPSQVASLTPTVHSAESTNTVVRTNVSDINDDSAFSPDDESTPVAPTGGLFSIARNIISRVSPSLRRRNAPEQASPLNAEPLPSQNSPAPPPTAFAPELLPNRVLDNNGHPPLTPRPHNIRYKIEKGRKRAPSREKELYDLSLLDGEDDGADIDDDLASLHEEDVIIATPGQIQANNRLLLKVNQNYAALEESLAAYKAAGINGKGVRPSPRGTFQPSSKDKMIINIIEQRTVEKIIEVPSEGPSMPDTFPLNALIIPATAFGDRIVLTDPEIIEMVRGLVAYTTTNPRHRLPDNADEMIDALQRFNDTNSLDSLVTDLPSTAAITTGNLDVHPDSFKTGVSIPCDADSPEMVIETTMTNAMPASDDIMDAAQDVFSGGEQSEVEELASSPLISNPATTPQAPQATPAVATTTPSGASGFFSAFKSLLSTPLARMGLAMPGTATPVADTNMGGISPASDYDFSPSGLRDPKSPTPFIPKGQRQRRNQASGPMRKKKYPLRKETNPLYTKVGLASAVDDIHAAERAKKRVAFNEVDEIHTFEADESSNLSPGPATGSKRKSPHTGYDEEIGGWVLPDSLFDSDDEEEAAGLQNDGSRMIDSHTDESPSIDSQPVHLSTSSPRYPRVSDGYHGKMFEGQAEINAKLRPDFIDNSAVGTSTSDPWEIDDYERPVFNDANPFWVTTREEMRARMAKDPMFNSSLRKSTSGKVSASNSTFGNSTSSNASANNSTFGNSSAGNVAIPHGHIDPDFTNCGIPGVIKDNNLYLSVQSYLDSRLHQSYNAPNPSMSTPPYNPSSTPTGTTSVEDDSPHSGTFRFPENDSDEDSSLLNDSTEEGSPAPTLHSETDGRNGPRPALNRDSAVAGSSSNKSVQNESSALTEKTWEQSLPPKVRPATALPPPYNKYVPEKPSHLSTVKNMSPMVSEVATREENEENVAFATAYLAPTPSPMEGDESEFGQAWMSYEKKGKEQLRDEEVTSDEIVSSMSAHVLDFVDSLPM